MTARSRASLLRLALVAGVSACVAASLAAAAPATQGLSLSWQDCRPPAGGGFLDQAFGCGSNIVEFPMFPSFSLASPIDSVYAMELVIDVDVASGPNPMPAWWAMQMPPCSANGWAADAAPSASCNDAWGGKGTGSFQGWLPGTPGASARHGRLLVAVSALPQDAVKLDAATPYTACRVLLRSANVSSCPDGCMVPACLVFNSLLIRRFHLPSDQEILVSGGEVAGSDRVTWQGGAGADCASVPTRRATWGAVKALYR